MSLSQTNQQKDPNLFIIDHPLVKDSLTHLRDKQTPLARFRHYSDQICRVLFSETLRGLSFKDTKITTPTQSQIASPKLADDIIIVPILRAGLAMMAGAMQMLPKVKIGLLGMERDEATAKASEYYAKIPEINNRSLVIVTDPMLATGGTIFQALEQISQHQCREMRVVTVVTAPEGLKKIRSKFPDVKIFTASLDAKLNADKYIIPGLGDYGDRYFGTTI